MKSWRSWPWGRTACVVGAVFSVGGLGEGSAGASAALATFVAAGVALHGLAIWKAKP